MPDTVVRLTPNARRYLTTLIADNPSAIGFSLSLDKAGCAGYMYNLHQISSVEEGVEEHILDDIHFYIKKDSVPRLRGTLLDYKQQGLEIKAVFINPNVVEACGCGDSVDLKESEVSDDT